MCPDSSRTPARPRMQSLPDGAISCRATNPLGLGDDVGRVFLDERQAKATTATRLFRNKELFAALRKPAMASFFGDAKRARGVCSIWSAGCSSGEEVYSLAMVALDEFTKKKIAPRLECFGTDINLQRLAEARAGLYGRPGPTSFDRDCWTLLNRYAQDIPQAGVQMGPDLTARCKFGHFDIRQKPKNHTFDFIVCNHVLQYYDNPGQLLILKNLSAVLRPGGFLYLEGITEDSRQAAGLQKIAETPNLFVPPR